MKRKLHQFGFSLVELSVVLTIVGITIGGALTLATKKTESDKIEETYHKMDIIEEAINTFLIRNQRLPCPADADPSQAHFSWQREQIPTTASCPNANFVSGNVYAGVFPSQSSPGGTNQSLGIDYKDTYDGWGRSFTYAVDLRLANGPLTNVDCDSEVGDVCFKFISDGSITVNDSSGNPLTTTAAYVLISHGKNGNGAWHGGLQPGFGSAVRLAASGDADEQENAGDDEGAFDTTFVQKSPTATFDDIVRYRTKPQLVVDAGGITDSGLCAAALFQVDNPDHANATCTGIADETSCRALAAKVSYLCLDATR